MLWIKEREDRGHQLRWHPGPTLRCPTSSSHWCDQRAGNTFIKHQYLLNSCLFVTKLGALPGWQTQPGHSQLFTEVCHNSSPCGSVPNSCFPFLHSGNECSPWGNALIQIINTNNRGTFLLLFGDYLLKIPKLLSIFSLWFFVWFWFFWCLV